MAKLDVELDYKGKLPYPLKRVCRLKRQNCSTVTKLHLFFLFFLFFLFMCLFWLQSVQMNLRSGLPCNPGKPRMILNRYLPLQGDVA